MGTDPGDTVMGLHQNVIHGQYWLDYGFSLPEAEAIAGTFALLARYRGIGTPEELEALAEREATSAAIREHFKDAKHSTPAESEAIVRALMTGRPSLKRPTSDPETKGAAE